MKNSCLLAVAMALFAPALVQGELITQNFNLRGDGTGDSNVFLLGTEDAGSTASDLFFTRSYTFGGVTFDGTLTIEGQRNGGGSDFNINQFNLGIATQGRGANDFVNDGEGIFVTFAINPGSVTGGTVTFDGFTEALLSQAAGTQFVSLDRARNSTGDNTTFMGTGATTLDLSNLTGASGLQQSLTFFATEGPVDNSVDNAFKFRNITGQFNVTAVPEPSSIALVAVGAAVVGLKRRRRAK